MKVFFTAPFDGKSKYQEYYDQIVKILEDYCDDVISPEAGNYLKTISSREKIKIKDVHKIHYEAIKRGILQSDLVVMEISHSSFRVGHEATLAILNKKPVLCLSLKENMADKIDSPYFFGAKYSIDNLEDIISEFINKHSKNLLNNRFNLFLSSSQLSYLDSAAKAKKISNSAYIRWLIDKDRN